MKTRIQALVRKKRVVGRILEDRSHPPPELFYYVNLKKIFSVVSSVMSTSRRKRAVLLFLSAIVSAAVVVTTQSVLFLVPLFLLTAVPLPVMLPIAGIVMVVSVGVGRFWKIVFGVRASVPIVVLLHLSFIWGFYVSVVRPVVSTVPDVIFHTECALLMVGLYSIVNGDPGFATASGFELEETGYSESNIHHNGGGSQFSRIRQCSSCKASVRGFDHHCHAFGNCIGEKNRLLFLILLIGFILTEASYTIFSFHYIKVFFNVSNYWLQRTISGNLVISTMLFSSIQVLWQVVFLMWHLYCVCFNIRTDEWVNWKRYPEFQLTIHKQELGENSNDIRFRNPYDKGLLSNIFDFLFTTTR